MSRSPPKPDPFRRWMLTAMAANFLGCGGRPEPTADAGRTQPEPADGGWSPPDAGEVECDRPLAEERGPCGATHTDLEGPYYIPGAPSGSDLVTEGLSGEPIWVQGTVFGSDCEPAAGATLDVWHADGDGAYDNEGWLLRRVLLAGDDGRFAFRTVLPGHYGTRPQHIHIKVGAPGHPTLTTQLYFSEDPKAPKCGPRLRMLLDLRPGPDGERVADFDFVLLAHVAEQL